MKKYNLIRAVPLTEHYSDILQAVPEQRVQFLSKLKRIFKDNYPVETENTERSVENIPDGVTFKSKVISIELP